MPSTQSIASNNSGGESSGKTAPKQSFVLPILCSCAQREHPHELTVHDRLWDGPPDKWPWSLRSLDFEREAAA